MTTGNGGAAIGLSNDNKLIVIGELVANEPDPRAGTSSYVGNDCTDTWWDRNIIAEDVGFFIPSCNEGFFIYWVTTGGSSVTLGAESRVAVTNGVITADVAGDYEAFFAPGTVIPAGMYLWVESGEIPPIEFIVADPIPDQTPVVDSIFTLDVSAHFQNGAPPVIYTIFSGLLPPGLTLAANGTVSGTPTTPGSTGPVVFRGTDNRGNSANSNGVLFTTVAALVFSGTIAAQSNVEDSAITPLNISSFWSGGATPLAYSVFSGTLPVGLTLDPATGIISGTPTTPAGAVALVFRATDAVANAVNSNSVNWTITSAFDANYSWTTTNKAPPASTVSLYNYNDSSSVGIGQSGWVRSATAITGKKYCEFAVTAENVVLTRGFGVAVVVPGIFYNTEHKGGIFKGNGGCTFPVSGTFNSGTEVSNAACTFAVNDRVGIAFDASTGKMWVRKNGGAWITGDPATDTSPLLTVAADTYYWYFSFYTCSVSGSAFQATIYPVTGNAIDGTAHGLFRIPALIMSVALVFRATDAAANAVNSNSMNWTITASYGFSTIPAQTPVLGTSFSLALASFLTGGTAPITYSIVSGALPYGVTLNTSTGVVSGVANTPLTGPVVFRATDAGALTADTNSITFTAAVIPDANYASNILLVHADGANNTTVFTDNGPLALAITVNGTSRCSTTQVKYGQSSGLVDVAGGTIQNTTSFAAPPASTFLQGNCTVELWVNYPATAGNMCFTEVYNNATNRINISLISGFIHFYTETGGGGGSSRINVAAPAVNTWHHIAVVKSGSTWTLYVNGVASGTSGTTVFPPTVSGIRVGGGFSGSFYTGYWDEARHGAVARYTGRLSTPQTYAFANTA